MIQTARLIAVAVTMVSSLACRAAAPAGVTTADQEMIRQVLDAEMQAAASGDEASWSALYTQDAIVLPPHGVAVQGRDEIQRWLAELPPISNAKGESLELVGIGDLAYHRGTYAMTISLPGLPTPIQEKGKFLQIYRKLEDGEWRMAREIYNSDLPMPSPAPAPTTTQ
jgi:ketosteroid isomerase-like protein